MTKEVIVIGAGVIGLSCALNLLQRGHVVTLIARDLPMPFETALSTSPDLVANYTSLWGGAHNRWIVPSPDSPKELREHAFACVTYRHMDEIASHFSEAGITFMKGIEYMETPSELYKSLSVEKATRELGMPGFRLLEIEELPAQVVWGCEYRTWCVNPMVYCMFLLRRFSFLGGKIEKHNVQSPVEPFAQERFKNVSTIINATGIGFDDSAVFPTRGQTCLVANNCTATVTRQNADGSWTFCVPRNFHGGTVIGGTKEPHDLDIEPRAETRKALLETFAATWPEIVLDDVRVLRDIVGRRPTRKGGPRIEREVCSSGDGGDGSRTLVHAYGLGGRGFELSWGVAEEVAKLVEVET